MHSQLFTSALSLAILTTTAQALALPQPEAYDNGMWTQQAAGTTPTATYGYTTGTAQAWSTAKAATYTTTAMTTTAAQATGTAAAAAAQTGGWEMTAIWPVGCDTWANPCPPGAHMSNGQIAGAQVKTAAGYENGFTSYTTMTDSRGVITGMPSVATVPAGMSTGVVSAMTTSSSSMSMSSSGNKTTMATSSSTQSGFSTTGSTAKPSGSFTGSASSFSVAKIAVVAAAAGAAMMML